MAGPLYVSRFRRSELAALWAAPARVRRHGMHQPTHERIESPGWTAGISAGHAG